MKFGVHRKRAPRFLMAGALNTIATWLIYIFLLEFLSYLVSYTIAYAIGVLIASVLYRFFVFEEKAINHGYILISLLYVAQYILGIAVAALWTERIGGPVELAPIVSLLVVYPMMYMAANLIFRTGELS